MILSNDIAPTEHFSIVFPGANNNTLLQFIVLKETSAEK